MQSACSHNRTHFVEFRNREQFCSAMLLSGTIIAGCRINARLLVPFLHKDLLHHEGCARKANLRLYDIATTKTTSACNRLEVWCFSVLRTLHRQQYSSDSHLTTHNTTLLWYSVLQVVTTWHNSSSSLKSIASQT